MASVRFEHVSKRYGGVLAVSDLSLGVHDGECMVVVGPSGSGKSTVLRMTAGLEPPSAGRILIGERDVSGLPTRDRDVAMVFQDSALYPHWTAYRNLAFGLEVHGLARPAIEERVGQAGLALGLRALLGRRPAELSGGHQQQVALGRAMVRQPRVFLLDQPLANLDAPLRAELRLQLRRLHRELGATFILATHDQVEAMTLGDRVAVLHGGVLQQLGSPRALYEHPANRYVAGFIGSPPMNFVPVEVRGRSVVAAGFRLELPWVPDRERAVLGIRPEYLQPAGAEQADVGLLVDLVDELGPHQMLRGRAGPDELTARVARDLGARPGELVPLRVDRDQLHLFDAATGEALI